MTPLLFGVSYFYTRRAKNASREVRRKEGEIVSLLQEVLSAITVVKAFAREDYEQQRLEEGERGKPATCLARPNSQGQTVSIGWNRRSAWNCRVLWYGGLLVLSGALTAGSLLVFIWYLGKMYKPMQDFAKMTDSFTKASVGYERIREVMETRPTVQDMPGARPRTALRRGNRIRSRGLQLHH